MKTRIYAFISVFALCVTLWSQDPNFHIYLCFGQSNMEGQGAIAQQDLMVNKRFQVLQAIDCENLDATKGTWRVATPPLCQCYTGLSPVDYFGKTMIASLPDSIRIGVVLVAVGGCDIRLFDKVLYQKYDSTYTQKWFQDKIKNYGGNPYQHLIQLAKKAQQKGVIKGILLHQGETNNGDAQWPVYVQTIYQNMVSDLRLDANSTPLLVGEVVHKTQGGKCAGMNEIIGTLPNYILNAHVISSEGCLAKADSIHFNAAGYRTIGTRYAEQMLKILHDPCN